MVPGMVFQGATTKCHRMVGLNIRNLFSHKYGSWKSEIKAGFLLRVMREESVPKAFLFGL